MPESLHQLAIKPGKETKVEEAKLASRLLRGSIGAVLNDPAKPEFEHDDVQLLKFHGIYQQEDRDSRAAAKVTGETLPAWFMTRIKVPGGILTPEQYLAMDTIADELTYNQSLRVTTRQNFQLHGILKVDLKQAIRRVNECLLSTLSGGDVARNIMAPPAPLARPAYQAARGLAQTLSDAMCPRTPAYFEIWMDEEKVAGSAEAEPLYGPQYLPRKFKTAIAVPEDNSVDVHSQDAAFVAILEGDTFKGANVLVGGGAGLTHKMERTYARLASPLGFVDAKDIVEALQIIAAMFRDYGDRTDRKHAQLKYVCEELGMDAFRAEFQHRASFKLKPWVETGPLLHQDWLGKHEQGDGKFFYGVFIPNGRIIDTDIRRMKTALRKIVETLRCDVILTPNQNILFGNLDVEQVTKIERILDAYNVLKADQVSRALRHSMACVALPTCGLALTESERVMPEVVAQFERVFAELGVEDAPVTIRMTGCPNGCARPYTADIGLVGHKPGHYDIFLGGRIEGDRMTELFAENVAMEELVPTLRPLLEAWSIRRQPEENFGDFYNRVVADHAHRHLVTGAKDNPTRERAEQSLLALPVL